MASSGLYTFALPNAGVIAEAFDRIQLRLPDIDRHMMISARASMNLELLAWSLKGFNFWKTTSGTINLAANVATYAMPANLITVEEVYYTTVNALGTGVNSDRIMVPITRTQYAAITNKLQPGIPTQYWYQMLSVPQITVWEVPAVGQVAPGYVLNWYGLQQIQDANLQSAETPDIPYRAYETLCAKMALRMCEKFGPKEPQARQMMMLEKKTLADIAWEDFTRRDQEPGPVTFRPNVQVYGRMRR